MHESIIRRGFHHRLKFFLTIFFVDHSSWWGCFLYFKRRKVCFSLFCLLFEGHHFLVFLRWWWWPCFVLIFLFSLFASYIIICEDFVLLNLSMTWVLWLIAEEGDLILWHSIWGPCCYGFCMLLYSWALLRPLLGWLVGWWILFLQPLVFSNLSFSFTCF